MSAVSYRQLFPQSRTLTAQELVTSLDLVHHDPGIERPYTVVNFVSSVDGRTAVGEHSRALSDDSDRELHRTLRERADAVLAGPGTIAAEDYGRMLPAQARRARRTAAGRSAEPILVTATRSGGLPLETRVFAEPESRVVVFSPTPPDGDPAADVVHRPYTSLSELLATLRREHDVQMLLCEGGPTLFSALLREGLVDELFLTLAPLLAGGAGPAVASGPPPDTTVGLTLAGLMESAGSLFLRYTLS